MNSIVLNKLSILQNGLNEYITPNWKENRTELDFMIASTLEMAELIDSETEVDGVKYSVNWKWWKGLKGLRTTDSVEWSKLHSDVINNIKIELTDLGFFTLSQMILNDHTDPDEIIRLNENDWVNFMSIVANNLLQRPSAAMSIILDLAEKLQFNIAAYYMAKHLLNYYRQISKYGEGYEKVVNGKEDNELLHDIIVGITFDDINDNFDGTYNLIASKFFKIFKAPTEKEINIDFWYNLIK